MKLKYLLFSIISLACMASTLRAETYTINTGQFVKIKVTSDVDVVYRCLPDSTGFAQYSTLEGKGDIFFLDVKKDGTLRVQVTDPYWGKSNLPTLYVYSDFLSGVENSSDHNLTVENLAPCPSFSANQIGNGSIIVEDIKCNNVSAAVTTGNGSVNLSGKCVNANFRMVGAGLISADRLQAENVKCSILGTGSIGCWPVDNLTVKGLGSTKIYYKGSPNIKKSGGCKLFELPEENVIEDYDTVAKVVSFDNPIDTGDEEDDSDDEEDEEDDDDYQTVVTADD